MYLEEKNDTAFAAIFTEESIGAVFGETVFKQLVRTIANPSGTWLIISDLLIYINECFLSEV